MAGSLINKNNYALEPLAQDSTYITIPITIPAASWSNSSQDVDISYAIGDRAPFPFFSYTINIPTEDIAKWAEYGICPTEMIVRFIQIRFTCKSTPVEDLTFTLTVAPMASVCGQSGTEYTLSEYTGGETSVKILDGVMLIDSGVFKDNTDIETVELPQYLFTKIKSEAFKGCTALTEITGRTIPEVGANAFEGCTALTSVTLSGTNSIADYAFKNCTALESITFVSDFAVRRAIFDGCTAVTSVTFEAASIAGNLDLSFTDSLTQSCLNDIIGKLYDYSGGETHTLTIGADNKARITAEKLQEAASKNWTVN